LRDLFDFDDGRARLRVPAFELGEIGVVGISHRGAEVIARHGGAVVALKLGYMSHI